MAVTYGFFNSVNGDRKYNAEQMSEYFRGIVNEGVFQHLDGGLAVTAGTGLAVSVASGRAIIQNRWVQNSDAMTLSISAASETYARKDAVVVRLNYSTRSIEIAVKAGTPAASPVAPSMTRNSTTYEMALAYVNVAANATSVTVTDKRSDSTVCGWVTVAQSTSGEVDAQLNAMKTGFDGVTYSSPAAMVQGCDQELQDQITEDKDNIVKLAKGRSITVTKWQNMSYGATHYGQEDQSTWACHTDAMDAQTMTAYFDDSKYKLLMNRHNRSTGNWGSYGAWITSSPYIIEKSAVILDGTYDKMIIEIADKNTQPITDDLDRVLKTSESVPSMNSTIYVTLNGSDSDTGESEDHAVATISKALTLGNNILVERGTYNDTFDVSNLNDVKIVPLDNNDEYSHGVPNRKKIVVNGGNEIKKTSMTYSGGLYSATVSGGYNFSAVFTSHSLAPIINEQNQIYRVNCFAVYNDISKKVKLKPVLASSEVEETQNSFTWNGTTIYCNISDDSFDHIAVINNGICGKFTNCKNINMEDVEFINAYSTVIEFEGCTNVNLTNCEANYSATSHGFSFINSNAIVKLCKATHNGYDGFNFHGYGASEMSDCSSVYNYDDGCSHHDGCVGVINGGIFTGNGKCGIAPAYGAMIDIYDVIADSNPIGIGYLSTTSGHQSMYGKMGDCLLRDNSVGLSVNALCTVDAVNVKYSGNTTDKNVAGILNEY